MARFVVIREEDSAAERLVKESAIPKESVLHRVLMSHPSLVPATDLGLGRVAAVGFEASLSSGSADLVLLDDAGRLCIVEVKKEGNPDTRRVVAQLLDYAAALWGLTLEEFEQDVIRDQDGKPRNLRELVREELVAGAEDPESATEKLLEDLALTLRAGDFELVVAAPIIPERVQRVMEYLNNQGQRLFGLEVSYFASEGEVEAFVPRVVVRPSLGTTGGGHREKHQWDEESFLKTLKKKHGSAEAAVARELIEWARVEMPHFKWGKGGKLGSLIPELDHAGREYSPLALWTNGTIEMRFGYLRKTQPFNDVKVHREFLRRLNEIPGVSMPEDAAGGFSTIRLDLLAASQDALNAFKGVLDWFCETVRADGEGHPDQ